MSSILPILHELAATTKKTKKKEILLREKNNELLKKVIYTTYSKDTVFNIKQIPEPNIIDTLTAVPISLDTAIDRVVTEFCVNGIRGDAASTILRELLAGLTQDDKIVLTRVIKRDLRVGITAKTANEIWEGLIYLLPIMNATANSQNAIDKLVYPCYADLKADGARSICIVKDNVVTIVTKNNKVYKLLDKIESDIKALGVNNVVIDGELVYTPNGVADRAKSNGVANKSTSGTITHDESDAMVYHVWDMIPYDEYFNGKSKEPLSVRRDNLLAVLDKSGSKRVIHIEYRVCNNFEEVLDAFYYYLSLGLEGIVAKNISALWKNTRSSDYVKFKDAKTGELRILELIEGTGKLQGHLGAFIIGTDDGLVRNKCGIGDKQLNSMTEEFRKYVWEHQDEFINAIGEFKYNYVNPKKNDDGYYTLFLPRFMRTRFDKDETNTYKELK